MALEQLGVVITREFDTRSIALQGIEVHSRETTALHVTLPRPTAVQASFHREGVGRKVVKLFKKELQIGDATFDDAVHISTTDEAATQAFLSDQHVRDAIVEIVEEGGCVEIAGTVVEIEVAGHESGDDLRVTRIVEALLA